MSKFIKGLDLCEGFFNTYAKNIIESNFPDLKYTAGLIGYGSDVLGYDDVVSTDHMWGPRFYMFLDKKDIELKDKIFQVLSENLPYTYEGYSVNFTEPDPNDCGVQHPQFITEGKVNPLVFIQTFDEYLIEQLGTSDLDNISYFGRDIKVIFADKFVDATVKELRNTAFENTPLIGTLSQFGGLSSFADEKEYYEQITRLYEV